jgi:predicted PhzF superfamily epimerase YddE/YHI9
VTLASAFIVFAELGFRGDIVHFHSKSGRLTVSRNGDVLTLDFPSRPPGPCAVPEALIKGLGKKPVEILKARDYFCIFANADDVRSLQPDFGLLGTLDEKVIVTASGTDCDFVSRFFAPTAGVNEDPVTGSAHCTLIPYWAKRLGKAKLFARQLSKRGGELFCEDAGERVRIGGNAVLYSRGEIELPEIKP